jgi:crotonobetainyl-CoA:carnitine CoA-transferase CaiB-like acyl-CoA transferase
MEGPMNAREGLAALWRSQGGAPEAVEAVELSGDEVALPSSFAIGTAAQASIAAAALAAREIGRLRGGPAQGVHVDMRHAAIEFRSERYLRVNGAAPPDPWDRVAGAYRCADGWVRLHTNFPHHRDGLLRLLGCAHERDAVQRALMDWGAEAFETAAAEAGIVGAALRSFAQWDAHPQGQAVAALPVLSIERIGDAPPQALPAWGTRARPLEGLRVLDLTRVIAGPVCGRTLAAHGADVLLVTAPHLPAVAPLVVDTGRGKLSTQIDLREQAGRDVLGALASRADVFVQGYRPGGLAALGFAPEQLAERRPGIVCASLSAYGHVGPWSSRRGFDSLVQTASGFNVAEGQAAGTSEPKVLPAQALDHGAGYLLAFGIQMALLRRAVEGGNWHVRTSLAQVGQWLRGLGRLPDGLAAHNPTVDDVQDLLEQCDSGFGTLHAVRHAGQLLQTPPRWDRPSVPLGSHAPAWPERSHAE